MRIFLVLFISFLSLFSFISEGQTKTEEIAVIVNDQAITMSNIQDRMRLIIASSGLQNTPELRQKLTPQIISSLIDEEIRRQEGKRLEIEVTEYDRNSAFAEVAKSNNLKPDQFKEVLKRNKVNINTLYDQIESQISWGKVIQKRIRPKITIRDADIKDAMDRIMDDEGRTEYLLAEIYLPIDESASDSDMRSLSYRLVDQIRTQKAPFFRVAQQFSKAAGSDQGGNLGWVQEGQLAEELDDALKGLKANSISDPIRTSNGYHILFLRDKRIISKDTLPAEDDMRQSIGMKRLERLQRQYFLELKSSAFIESRV